MCSKFRTMLRYTVFFITVGLLIAGIGAPKLFKLGKKKSVMPMINIIEDLNVDPIENLGEINLDNASAFFSGERNLFHLVKCIYGIDEPTSTSNPQDIAPPNCHKDILALAHITILAFWTAVNFRICSIIFSIFEDHNKVEYEPLKTMCSSYFTEMCFTFRVFKEHLKKSVDEEAGKCSVEGSGNINAVKQILTVSLDLVSDEDTLTNQEPDYYFSKIIDWKHVSEVETKSGKFYKTMFLTDSFVRENYNGRNNIEDMYKYLCNQVTEVMDFGSMWHIRFNLTKQIVKTIVFSVDFAKLWDVFHEGKYTNNLQIWQRLLEEQLAVDSEAATVHRISKMIEIMEKIRIMHYTIIYKSLNYIE